MTLQAIPKVSFLIATGEKAVVDDPNDVPVMNKTIPEGLNPIVIAMAETIAKDHVYNLGLEFKERSTARLTCSVEHGVVFNECSNPRMREYYLTNSMTFSAVPSSEAQKMGKIHLIEPPLEKREEVETQFGEDIAFVDYAAVMFFETGLNEPVTVDLEVNPFMLFGDGEGLTTGNMRYPHMLLKMQERLDAGEHPSQSCICIVGPGLLECEGDVELTCPLFAELFALVPSGKFTLLDYDPRVLGVMQSQFGKQFASYDPVMLRIYTMNVEGNSEYFNDKKYQGLFQRMKEYLGKRASAPKDAKKMLAGYGKMRPLTLQLGPNQAEIRHFDINTANFKEGDRFDIMVATLSIFNASRQDLESHPKGNHFFKLAKFLKALNEGGSLYIDSLFMDALKRYGPGFQLGIRYLETLVGSELKIEEIPMPSAIKKRSGSLGTISSFSTNPFKDFEQQLIDCTTTAITVITRTKIRVDSSEKAKAGVELVRFLQSMQIG